VPVAAKWAKKGPSSSLLVINLSLSHSISGESAAQRRPECARTACRGKPMPRSAAGKRGKQRGAGVMAGRGRSDEEVGRELVLGEQRRVVFGVVFDREERVL